MSDWKLNWAPQGGVQKAGGQGAVLKVAHVQDGRLGALKLLHEEHEKVKERRFRMQQEVNALLALAGEGAPVVLDSNAEKWQDKTVPLWVVMEWIDGRTLQECLAKGPLALDEAINITRAILQTVGRCHALKIHHRDLKPDNIILRASDKIPIVVDFGMSWSKPDEEQPPDFKTGRAQELGNRFLRLPEHAPGRHIRDEATDLTMVVGLLFYMLTGVAPRVLQDSKLRMPHEFASNKFQSRTTADPRWTKLDRIFHIGFQTDADLRFSSAQDILDRLDDLLPAQPVDGEALVRQRLEMLNDLGNSEHARKIEKRRSLLIEASQRYLRAHDQALAGSPFSSAGSGPNAIVGRPDVSFRFEIARIGLPQPSAAFSHAFVVSDGKVEATVEVEGEPPETYYVGLVADHQSLCEAVDNKAPIVVAALLEKIHQKLAAEYKGGGSPAN